MSQKISGIDKALFEGCKLHCFRSGSGLRVVRIEDQETNKLTGYGEHFDVLVALQHANEDVVAGDRPYKNVHGKLYPQYLTGSSASSCALDAWILRGHTFDATKDGDQIVFVASGFEHVRAPKIILKEARANPGKIITWSSDQNCTYETIADDSMVVSTKCIKKPDGATSMGEWFRKIQKTGHGATFLEAVSQVFKMPAAIDIYGKPLPK